MAHSPAISELLKRRDMQSPFRGQTLSLFPGCLYHTFTQRNASASKRLRAGDTESKLSRLWLQS